MFTRSIDQKMKTSILALLTLVGVLGVSGFFGFQNRVTDVGYRPEQPVPFSHKLHADSLQIHCQYCHSNVEKSAHSTVPPTATCMNCHVAIKTESERLQQVRDSWEKGTPIEWRRIHKLPDYVNFNHSRHIRAQIDCASCHGEVEKMGVVAQQKPLSMGWCLDCHRNPQANIIPAREISGIFTGLRAYNDHASLFQNVVPGDGNWVKVKDGITEAHGGVSANVPSAEAAGIATPKKPGLGPENCSSCHY